jgi:uncharacterized protein YrrD
MIIEAKKIIGLPVASQDMLSRIGTIKQVLVDPENGQVLGFLIKQGGIFGSQKALSAMDIVDWDPNGLVTSSFENLVDPSEIVRIKEILDKNIILLGMKARTESGKRLGYVENFLIETTTNMIVKYYLKDMLGNARVLPADKVVKINKEIIFSDSINEAPPGAVGAAA